MMLHCTPEATFKPKPFHFTPKSVEPSLLNFPPPCILHLQPHRGSIKLPGPSFWPQAVSRNKMQKALHFLLENAKKRFSVRGGTAPPPCCGVSLLIRVQID